MALGRRAGAKNKMSGSLSSWTMPPLLSDPRIAALASDLARRRGSSMTEAIIAALEAEIARHQQTEPLPHRLRSIADELARKSRPGGRRLERDEIDELWGS